MHCALWSLQLSPLLAMLSSESRTLQGSALVSMESVGVLHGLTKYNSLIGVHKKEVDF